LNDFPFAGYHTLTFSVAKRCIEGERSSRPMLTRAGSQADAAVLEAWLRVGRGAAIRIPLKIAASMSNPIANNHRLARCRKATG
jgi:hypothetical protein